MTIDRRTMLTLAAGAAILPLYARSALAQANTITMWRDPGCGCCVEWAKRMEAAFGAKVSVVNSPNMAAVKTARGVPDDLRSCHTAMVRGVVVEGHVPPADIKRLLAARPKGITGLAVPGMPAGSPGMDVGHNHKQAYQVIAFGPGNRRLVWAKHGA
ncbi:MAG TPA: DUF411 domain-containing protein [Allosphingosinicella sp.]|jgi:hypothetical protein